MEKILQLNTEQYWTYIQKYWFQITIISILCFIFWNRDLSFQINMNTPDAIKQSSPITKQPRRLELTEKATVVDRTTTARSGILQGLGQEPEKGMPRAETVAYQSTGELDDWAIESYIKRFKHVAIKEQEKYKIPASIIMANALFHSFAGQNELAAKGNNHFGLTCKGDWNGKKQNLHKVCYRQYATAWESFRDHSLYLEQERFSSLHQYDITDYAGWAKGLERLEYGKKMKMAEQLVTIIERYKLYQLDLNGI